MDAVKKEEKIISHWLNYKDWIALKEFRAEKEKNLSLWLRQWYLDIFGEEYIKNKFNYE